MHVIGPIRHAALYNRVVGMVAEGLDVIGCLVVVDDQHVVHAARRYDNGRTEAKRGQLAVDRDDFSRSPRILGDPDAVEPGETGRRGGPAVVVTKVIGGVRCSVVVEVRTRQRLVVFVSMFKGKVLREGF